MSLAAGGPGAWVTGLADMGAWEEPGGWRRGLVAECVRKQSLGAWRRDSKVGDVETRSSSSQPPAPRSARGRMEAVAEYAVATASRLPRTSLGRAWKAIRPTDMQPPTGKRSAASVVVLARRLTVSRSPHDAPRCTSNAPRPGGRGRRVVREAQSALSRYLLTPQRAPTTTIRSLA